MKTSELSGAALDWAVAKCEIDMLWIGEQAFCCAYQFVTPASARKTLRETNQKQPR